MAELQDVTLAQEGGTTEPTSGNKVPLGGTAEGVADKEQAKLSVGEFVFPEFAVRYFGIKHLMRMRDEAVKGFGKMEEMGQLGNSDTAAEDDTSALFSEDDFEYTDVPDDYEEPMDDMVEMAIGGLFTGQPKSYAVGGSAAPMASFGSSPLPSFGSTAPTAPKAPTAPAGFGSNGPPGFEDKDKKAKREAEAAALNSAPSTSIDTSGGGEDNSDNTGSTGTGTTTDIAGAIGNFAQALTGPLGIAMVGLNAVAEAEFGRSVPSLVKGAIASLFGMNDEDIENRNKADVKSQVDSFPDMPSAQAAAAATQDVADYDSPPGLDASPSTDSGAGMGEGGAGGTADHGSNDGSDNSEGGQSGWAKGGFISRKSPKTKKSGGLAGRRR